MISPKRVLLISPQPYFAWRGSSIRVKFDVRALADLGYEVDLLTLPIGEDEASTPGRVIRVWNLFGSNSISIGPSVLKLWFDLLLFIKGLLLVISNRYDVIHGTEEAGFLAWLLSKPGRCKSVYEKHSDAASYKKGALQNIVLNAYLAVEHFTCRHADLVICTGPGLKKQAESVAPNALIHDISDIPSSLVVPQEEEIASARKKLGATENQVLVTYVGSFAVYQGIDIIFDAIPLVYANQNVANSALRFVIIGGNAEQIAERSKTLAAQGISSDLVHFAGLIPPDELPAYLAASDILMAPRKAGVNTPLKVLDYFKAGGAIVATDTEANRFILDSSCARLCEFSAAAFAQAIVDLAADPDQRNKLAEAGHTMYQKKFNFEVFTSLLGDAYQDMQEIK